jgi:ADP-ribosylglycohydrolase
MGSDLSLEDRFEGCFLGLAIGDALGYPTEFLSYPEILQRFGPEGIQDLRGNPSLHSDDTQLSMAVAKALLKAGQERVEDFMEALTREYLAWFRSPENDRAPGNTTIRGCQNLESGVPWNQSGIVESKGCGANMRVAPIGLYFFNQPQQLRAFARASALATHAHPTALVAAEATASCVSWAVQGVSPTEYIDRIAILERSSVDCWEPCFGDVWRKAQFDGPQKYLKEGWDQLLAQLKKVPQAVAENPPDICSMTGGGWVADDALACALACVLIYPENYSAAVRKGANNSGDSDSIASIAGATSGALLGVNAIPKEWRKRVENCDQLLDLAKQFISEREAAR